jgi:hypothetical protein
VCRSFCESINALVMVDLGSLEAKKKAYWGHLLAQNVILNTRAKIGIVNVGVGGKQALGILAGSFCLFQWRQRLFFDKRVVVSA